MALAVVAALLPLALLTLAAPARATEWPTVTIQGPYFGMAVDPVSGRVVIARDDVLDVFDTFGVPIASVPMPDQTVGGMIFAGPDLYVLRPNAHAVARVDMASLTVVQSIPVAVNFRGGGTLVGGALWLTSSDDGSLLRVDLSTGITTNRGWVDGVNLMAIPNRPNELVAYGWPHLSRYDITTNPPTRLVLNEWFDSAVGPITADGSTLLVSGSQEYGLSSFDVTTMHSDGRHCADRDAYGAPFYTAAKGGLAAEADGHVVLVCELGRPALTHRIDIYNGNDVIVAAGIAPSGDRVHTLVDPSDTPGQPRVWKLETLSLAPTIASSTSSSDPPVADAQSTVTVTGNGIGHVTAATIDGVAAPVLSTTATQAQIRVPNGVAPGPRVLSLTTPWGTATTSVTVVADVGATIHGTLSRGPTPVGGATITLTGTSISTRTTTSAGDGTFQFTGIPTAGLDPDQHPAGPGITITASDPAGGPDARVERLRLRPDEVRSVPIELLVPPAPADATISRTALGLGPVRALYVDPATGRIFVSVGDRIVVFDADGTRRTTIPDMWGADQFAAGADGVYAVLNNGGRIVRLGGTGPALTGSWPTTVATSGGLVVAGGRAWFPSGPFDHLQLAALDLANGTVQEQPYYTDHAVVSPVQGSTNLFLVGSTSDGSNLMDGSTFPATTKATGPRTQLGDAGAGRAWACGTELHLTSLDPDGLQYPIYPCEDRQVAYTSGHGGVLALGNRIAATGTPVVSHQLPEIPPLEGLGPGGDRAWYISAAGELVQWDLAPHLTWVSPIGAAEPGPLPYQPGALLVKGTGLGRTTALTVDGNPVPFTVTNAGELHVDLPDATKGSHALQVTTPWGTSAPIRFVVIADPPAGTSYHPLTPTRVLDSRTATGGWNGPVTSAAQRWLTIPADVVPPASVRAVVLNVTVTNSTAPSYLKVFPAWSPMPTASNLNFAAGQTIPNLVVVPTTGGPIAFATAAGAVDVVADVVGYYDSTPGSLFNPITPVRALDSRGPTGGWNGPLTAGAPRDLAVRGPSVPASATAIVANVTATRADTPSFLTAWPAGVARPTSSSLNFAAGQTIANLTVLPIGANGKVSFANASGSVDVIVDIVGYFDPTGGTKFHPIAPTRLLDDRIGVGLSGPWTAGATRSLRVAGTSFIPPFATGVVGNLTATNATTGSFVSIFPSGSGLPTGSSINFGANQTIPNAFMIGLGNQRVDLYNQLGTVDLVADAVGYYAPT